MLYAFYKAGINKTGILIVLIFWSGLFQYFGEIAGVGIHNLYKVVLVAILLLLSWRKIFAYNSTYDTKVNIIFFIFSISFWVSYMLYGGSIITILSQYFYKYSFVFLLYHYFKDIQYDKTKGNYTVNLLLTVLFIQIGLSIVKLLFIGIKSDIQIYEPIVGSMSSKGAGLAVVMPILALIFYWVLKKGKLERKDWYIVISFIIIAFASAKRQPIVFFPSVAFLLIVFSNRRVKIFSLFKYLPLAIALFIFGVKLNPSFNPENQVWGSFDWKYLSRYISNYYFGTSNIDAVLSGNIDTGMGRGGGLIYYFQPSRMTLNSTKEVLFGKGLYDVATWSKGRFTGSESDYGLDHQGLMGDAGLLVYSIGYLGTILMIIMAVYIILRSKNKRIATIILLYFAWDFLFYYNQVVFSNHGSIVLLSIIFYSNYLFYYDSKIIRESNFAKSKISSSYGY